MIVLEHKENNSTLVGSSEESWYPFVIKRKTSKMFGRGLVYWDVSYQNQTYMQYFSKQEAVDDAVQAYKDLVLRLHARIIEGAEQCCTF